MKQTFMHILIVIAFSVAVSGPLHVAFATDGQPAEQSQQQPTAQPTTQNPGEGEAQTDATAAESPAPSVEAYDLELVKLLERIEAKSSETRTLQAKVRYTRIAGLLGDEQVRFGRLQYDAGPPARFALHFDRLHVDDRMEKQDHYYIFDGRWLVMRRDSEKQFEKYEIVPPDAKPEDADPLALGEGPFVVPVSFEKNRVLKRFHVERIEPNAEEDPKDGETVHLKLTPREEFKRELDEVHLWYDKDTLLPRRAATVDDKGRGNIDENIIDLMNVEPNSKIDADSFDTAAPSDKGQRGWLEEIRPWGK